VNGKISLFPRFKDPAGTVETKGKVEGMLHVREYETLYIVAPNLAEDEQQSIIDSLAKIVKKADGELIKNDVWGKRKLAFPLKNHEEGVYVLLRFKGTSTIPAEIETQIRRTPELLRHLTTVVTKQQLKEEARLKRLEAKRAEEARKAAEEAAKREAEAEEKAAAEAKAAEEKAAEEAAEASEPSPAEAEAASTEPETATEDAGEAATSTASEESSDKPETPVENTKEAVGE